LSKKNLLTRSLLSTTLAVSLGAGALHAAENPFSLEDFRPGFTAPQAEGSCGEGKCGGSGDDGGEGKCGEGKCGS